MLRQIHQLPVPGALTAGGAAYGSRPPWAELHWEILRRCREMLEFCERWQAGPSARAWAERITIVRSWTQLPDG